MDVDNFTIITVSQKIFSIALVDLLAYYFQFVFLHIVSESTVIVVKGTF